LPVIINEFEIISESPEAPSPGVEATERPAERAQTLSPEDIVRIQRLYQQRLDRIWAD
jgi:hypothetical protein